MIEDTINTFNSLVEDIRSITSGAFNISFNPNYSTAVLCWTCHSFSTNNNKVFHKNVDTIINKYKKKFLFKNINNQYLERIVHNIFLSLLLSCERCNDLVDCVSKNKQGYYICCRCFEDDKEFEKNELLAQQGHIVYKHGMKGCPGEVYVCYIKNGLYKIGATQVSVENRLKQQRLKFENLVCTIRCSAVGCLERYLHSRFSNKRNGDVEHFFLDENDIRLIKNIRTLNNVFVFVENRNYNV